MENILHVDFLIGIKKKEFNLNLISHFFTESGGFPWMNKYNLVLDTFFYNFWNYVKKRYSENNEGSFEVLEAQVEQKTRGINNKGYPWINSLIVVGETRTEEVIFFPHTCGLLDEIQVEEYREYIKSTTEFL